MVFRGSLSKDNSSSLSVDYCWETKAKRGGKNESKQREQKNMRKNQCVVPCTTESGVRRNSDFSRDGMEGKQKRIFFSLTIQDW